MARIGEKKVWKTLMSIERRRNKQKRSDRTLIAITSEAGWTGFAGFFRMGGVIAVGLSAALRKNTKINAASVSWCARVCLLQYEKRACSV